MIFLGKAVLLEKIAVTQNRPFSLEFLEILFEKRRLGFLKRRFPNRKDSQQNFRGKKVTRDARMSKFYHSI